jgi:hypothetical protein
MAKLKSTPIAEKDLKEFLASESDFAFEMTVLSLLRKIGFNSLHSGTYQDPVTKKIRQFDLRAGKNEGNFLLTLAVECKNLRANFPLLITAVPRTIDEAFHEVIKYRESPGFMVPTTEAITISSNRSMYVAHEMVGKRTDQVGRTESNAELVSDDALTFDKISQAINSSEDLVVECLASSALPSFRAVVPILVVPSDVLWQVDYDQNGNITTPARRVGEATLFIDHSWGTMVGITGRVNYRISHLHIITVDNLEKIVNRWMGPDGFFRAFMEKP